MRGNMNFTIENLEEYGYEAAMRGLSRSYNQPVCGMRKVANTLYNKNNGHNKFLESIQVYFDITAPRYWWSEFDTYRIGVTKQSDSTMHTITKRTLTQNDFIEPVFDCALLELNKNIIEYQECNKKDKERLNVLFRVIKRNLPEGFLQGRTCSTNYKAIRGMISQRKNHRLIEWGILCDYFQENCRYKEWLV